MFLQLCFFFCLKINKNKLNTYMVLFENEINRNTLQYYLSRRALCFLKVLCSLLKHEKLTLISE